MRPWIHNEEWYASAMPILHHLVLQQCPIFLHHLEKQNYADANTSVLVMYKF
jgi:hypothetical protein